MTLRFNDDSYRAIPHPKRTENLLDLVLGDASVGISVVVVLVLGGIAASRYVDGSRGVGITLALIAVPFAVVLLIRAAVEGAAHVAFIVAVGAALLLCPLLLVPAVRRWAKRWWKREPAASHVNRRIFATDVEPVSVSRDAVVVLVGDQRIRYTASDGDALEREFRTMLKGSAAAGIGP